MQYQKSTQLTLTTGLSKHNLSVEYEIVRDYESNYHKYDIEIGDIHIHESEYEDRKRTFHYGGKKINNISDKNLQYIYFDLIALEGLL